MKRKSRRPNFKSINVYLSIGFPGADHHETIEVEEDATKKDIEQSIAEWAGNYIEFGQEDDE